jgi:PAS domain S-box-containing protein
MGKMLRPSKLSPARRVAFKIAGIYAVVALLWILFSDEIIRVLTVVPSSFSLAQTLKGSFFVATTATLLYWLVYRDIVVIRRSQETLTESEERYRELIENANDIIYTHDLAGSFTSLNKAGEKVSGYTRDEILKMNITQVVIPEHVALIHQMLERKLAGEGATVYELQMVAKDGRRIALEVSTRLIYQGEQPIGTQGIARDITERKQAEEVLQRYTERLTTMREIDRGILSARAPDEIAYAALSRIRRLIACQLSSVIFFDFTTQTFLRLVMDLSGESSLELGKPYPLAAFGDIGILQRGEVMKADDLAAQQDLPDLDRQLLSEGTRSYIRIPLITEGELLGSLNLGADRSSFFSNEVIEIAHEVADQLAIAIRQAKLYKNLQRTNTKLAEAVQAKDEMLQNVSHELRTPLTHIRGYSDILLDGVMGDLSNEQRHALAIIQSRAQVLTLLVNDLLTLQTFEKSDLRPDAVDLPLIARAVIGTYRATVLRPDITFVEAWDGEVPPALASKERLEQVIRNLVDNAIKFSPSGGTVTVRIWNDEKSCYCSVSDQGIGIAPEFHERIFERFYQVNGSTTRRFGGTGIGLTLSKRLIEAYSGRIWVESSGIEGEGSTFTFSLPRLPENGSKG